MATLHIDNIDSISFAKVIDAAGQFTPKESLFEKKVLIRHNSDSYLPILKPLSELNNPLLARRAAMKQIKIL